MLVMDKRYEAKRSSAKWQLPSMSSAPGSTVQCLAGLAPILIDPGHRSFGGSQVVEPAASPTPEGLVMSHRTAVTNRGDPWRPRGPDAGRQHVLGGVIVSSESTLSGSRPGGDPDVTSKGQGGWPAMNPPVPPRPRAEVPSPYGPDGPFKNLHRCAQRLESGDWREVVVLLGGDGTSTNRLAVVTQLLALSMFQQTIGDVDQAWTLLGNAAAILPSRITSTDPETGQVTVRLQAFVVPGPEHPEIAQTGQATQTTEEGNEWRLTWTLAAITWREQTELQQLKARPHLYIGARDALVRACVEFMVWVEFAPETWRRQVPSDQLECLGIALPRGLYQPSRKNLCGRASKLRRFVDPAQGDVSDSVWADIGGYTGLKALALESLGAQQLSTWRLGARSGPGKAFPARAGCSQAWRFAKECSAPASPN